MPRSLPKARLRRRLVELGRMYRSDLERLESGTAAIDAGEDDLATLTQGQSTTIAFLEKDRDTYREIIAAIERLDANDYGDCESCEEAIGVARLEAIPYTRLCIACASNAPTRDVA